MNQSKLYVIAIAITTVTATMAQAQDVGPSSPAATATDNRAYLAPTPAAGSSEAKGLNPSAAVGLSVLGAGLGFGALIVGEQRNSDAMMWAGALGIAIGPSLGHFYTRDHTRAVVAAGVRAAGMAAMAGGVILSLDDSSGPQGAMLFLVGTVAAVGGIIYSVRDSRRSAHRINERNRRQLTLAPTPLVGPAQSTGMGMTLGGAF